MKCQTLFLAENETESDPQYYSKCPKISYTKVSDKMAYANSVDPDQTALEGAI